MPLIGFDAQATQGMRSGLGVYTSNLQNALETKVSEPFRLRIYTQERPPEANISTFQRLRWENWTLPARVKHDKVDLLHVPAFAPAFRKPCRLVLTVHDIAGMLFPNQIGWASAFYWGKWLPFAIRQADRIIADSEHTKRDLVEHLRLGEEKISVVYPSGHETFTAKIPEAMLRTIKQKWNIGARYFLFVGTLEPRKNLDRILRAFKSFLHQQPGFQLVLVGSQAFAHGKYAELLRSKYSLGSGSVIATGFLDHESLNALYGGAQALLFPSLYEGFGIPILEAMASGCPVITSQGTSLPEVAGDAALLVDPQSEEEIKNAMLRLATEPSLTERLRQRGGEQIKKFSWEKAARETLAIYRTLC